MSFNNRSLNLTQFLASGNTIGSPTDGVAGSSSSTTSAHNRHLTGEEFIFEDDLAKFTNLGEFKEIDFDGATAGFGVPATALNDVDEDADEHGDVEGRGNKRVKMMDGSKAHEFGTADSYPFNPFDFADPNYVATAPVAGDVYQQPGHHAQIFPAPSPSGQSLAGGPPAYPHQHSSSSPTGAAPTESSETRLAAEEDKRRRNTAASARFRVKKKEREKALEKNADELKKRNTDLEIQVEALRKENEWLKELVVGRREKIGQQVAGEGEEKVESERILGSKKKGVGTSA